MRRTYIDLTQSIPTIIRSGSITKQQIEEVLRIKVAEQESQIAKKYEHYTVDKHSVSATADEIVAAQQVLIKNKFGVIARSDVIRKLTPELAKRSIVLDDRIDIATSKLYSSIYEMNNNPFTNGFIIETRNDEEINKAFNNRIQGITQGRNINQINKPESVLK